nr:hypothetical protein QSJ49_11010 [Halobacterium salinarum]
MPATRTRSDTAAGSIGGPESSVTATVPSAAAETLTPRCGGGGVVTDGATANTAAPARTVIATTATTATTGAEPRGTRPGGWGLR